MIGPNLLNLNVYLFRPHLWGEELYTHMVFLYEQFWPIGREMWVVSLKRSSSVESEIKNIFLNFVLFEELTRFEILREHGIFVMILFTFSVIFLQITIFSKKKVIQNYISRHEMNHFYVPNGLKTIKDQFCSHREVHQK